MTIHEQPQTKYDTAPVIVDEPAVLMPSSTMTRYAREFHKWLENAGQHPHAHMYEDGSLSREDLDTMRRYRLETSRSPVEVTRVSAVTVGPEDQPSRPPSN